MYGSVESNAGYIQEDHRADRPDFSRNLKPQSSMCGGFTVRCRLRFIDFALHWECGYRRQNSSAP